MWIPHGEVFHAGRASGPQRTEVTGIEAFSAELVIYTPTVIVNYSGSLTHETQGFASLPGTSIAKIDRWLLVFHGTIGAVFSTSPVKYRCQLTTGYNTDF